MKKIIQIFLFLILIILSYSFYHKFLTPNKKKEDLVLKLDDSLSDKKNLIYNLEYKMNFDKEREYNIIAKNSELYSEGDHELIKLYYVIAILNDKNDFPIKISSDNAYLNDKDYNTQFFGNVKISYNNDKILSNKAEINFKTKKFLIFDNATYDGLYGKISTDNILVDLTKNKILLFMNEKNSNLKVIKN